MARRLDRRIAFSCVSPGVKLSSEQHRAELARAWESLQARAFPRSAEQLEDTLLDDLLDEMLYEDSVLAGAVTTLLGQAETERRFLEGSTVFEGLLAAARERRSEHPDIERVVDYAEELERVRRLALRLVRDSGGDG